MQIQKTTLLLIIASLFFSFSTQAKTKKLLRLNLEKGSVYEMIMDMNNDMDQEMMGQQIKMTQHMQMGASMTVLDVLPNNNFLISYNYTTMKMDMDAMGNKMSFDSNSQDTDNPAFDALKGITKIKLQMEITPLGKVENIEGFDSFSEAFGANEQVKTMLKMFSDKESFKSTFGQTFNYFPEDKISVGDSWNASQKMEAFMNMDIDMHFEVTDIQEDDVTLKVNSDINSNTSTEQNGMNMNIEMTGNQAGEMSINAKDGMLTSSNMIQDINMLMKMNNPQSNEDMEIPMKMNSTVKVTFNKK
ncbi:DUF6263 family protein [Sunxiuqinia sp. A32]|uniref:DUF6263 family protein n=1 Tax=Sunxiuqinia sp. A32 TaxID=3461496 RepID=UPI004045B0D2